MRRRTHEYSYRYRVIRPSTTFPYRGLQHDPAGDGHQCARRCEAALQGGLIRKAIDIPEIIQYILQLAADIDVGLFPAWLYDKLKSRSVERVIINRVEITEITDNSIRRVITEQIEEWH